MHTKWMRKCNECNHTQEDKEPIVFMTSSYEERKCKKCKSAGLDYGSLRIYNEKGEEINNWED